MENQSTNSNSPWKQKLHEIIFEADTKAGKLFDVVLLWSILISVVVVMLESVESLKAEYGTYFTYIEWTFTLLFSAEYIARVISIKKPLKYIFSFYGIVDLLSILPTFLGVFISGTQSLSVIRSLRLLRIFRVLKLGRFLSEADSLKTAMIASKQKIIVFLFAVMSATIIMGTLMYLIESKEAGFTSIPRSIYWAIVTLTTVGYGDIAPQSVLGQMIASFIMIIGYGIIAVPTGIIGAEISKAKDVSTQCCSNCSKEGHDKDAGFCKQCGSKL
ncbi:MAG: voltage-gated potassium channel [Saprospiraceae bacterium]|jgi:voltage-gated potassium channel